jgi:hypothetical protein
MSHDYRAQNCSISWRRGVRASMSANRPSALSTVSTDTCIRGNESIGEVGSHLHSYHSLDQTGAHALECRQVQVLGRDVDLEQSLFIKE